MMLNIMSLVALPAFVLCIAVLAVRGSLISSMPVVIACQVCGLALMVWARVAFPKGSFRVTAEPAGSQVLQRGPYRFIRHPMYAGALLILWMSIAGHLTIFNAGIGSLATVAILGKILLEERLLRASFSDYAQYTRSTKALIPLIL
jgi:protein-S-isoprenylcysteine O-methyltransferase Ste14